jgi:hypothetical protein
LIKTTNRHHSPSRKTVELYPASLINQARCTITPPSPSRWQPPHSKEGTVGNADSVNPSAAVDALT